MTSYTDMNLPPELRQALARLKFEKPTEVQARVIPLAFGGKDMMISAETGSGKTAAYGIPLVSRLLQDPQGAALILAPTRELVHQIADFLRELTKESKGLLVTSLVGGADMRKQLNALKRKPRLIVATPGRLTDHLRRKSLSLKGFTDLVLDEGDRMLDMGFAPQLDVILKYLPEQRQSFLFSATLPEKVRRLAKKYLKTPITVDVGQDSRPVASIRQSVIELHSKQKDQRILDELNQRRGSVIVFLRTQDRTDQLARYLHSYGYPVEQIHGGRTQGQRNSALRKFKSGQSRILCATDVAARGIDVPQVAHVINYDLPRMKEDYVHRIGRTGRNGASGEALSFVTPEDRRDWNFIVKKYQINGVQLAEDPSKKGGKKKSGSFEKRRRFASHKKKARTHASGR